MSGKRILYCFGLIFLFSAQIISAQNFADGELLVKYKNGTASKAAIDLNTRIGARVVEEFSDLKWQRVEIPENLTLSEATRFYKSNSEIETVQPNFYYRLLSAPNDARVSELYGMRKISALQAWDLSTGSAAVVIANIDTGVKYTHEDLAANMWRNAGEIPNNNTDDDGNGFIDDYYGWDFFYNRPDPMDENGHGTHTSGTIGAVGDNSLGIAGVNWNVRIMSIKIYDASGNGTTSAMLINAYNYIRLMKNRGVNIRVTNNSYGGCDEACGYDQATKDAIDALGDAGILQVFAAGNNGRNIETTAFYPASYTTPSILSVAASDRDDNRAGFSNFGVASVDLAAPGVGILSTVMSAVNYSGSSGTSMATPHAAGSAALLASYNPNLSAASIKATLMNTVDALPQWNGTVKTGGRLNVARALQNQTVCAFALDRNSQLVFPEGGTYRFTVTAPANCDYSAVGNANWIQIIGGATGSGGGVITFSVGTNSTLPRGGAIVVGGRTFTVSQSANEISPKRGFLDFNGDGRSDFTAIQNTSGAMLWHVFQGAEGYKTFNFGLFEDDIPVPAHYDADLKNDIAVWRASNGTFYVLRSRDNTFQSAQFGTAGDNPTVTQDFDGDGKADFAVTRKENDKLVWYILGTTSGFRAVQFGNASDRPLRGDYDGDGRADLAVYRPETGIWYIQKSRDGFAAVQFGVSTDKTVAADYDGDLKTDIAVWRPETGVWHYLKSSDGSYNAAQFGISRDLPTPGDYDGDGRTDFSVWRPNTTINESGVFYVYSVLSGFSAHGWGNSTMKIPANTLQSP
ncbi:MAG TPA: S8 family serine peptidase [Pyrinomonadaceae bacterium]|nr:S8 family serine peptidase [Pyrinomonadaceae bacterium]